MKRGWLLNLGLLAVVMALGWLAWQTPSRDEIANRTLSTLKPAQVKRIVLTRPGKPVIELERDNLQWRITAPLRARADEFQVLRVLTILEAKPSVQLPATDLARFDLQSPVARLTIDGVEYAYGGINSVTSEQYVQRGDVVYAVALRHGAALPADAENLVRRALLGENEQPVAIALPEFNLRQTNGKWIITPPATDTSQDDLQGYVDRWRHAFAARVQAYDDRQPLAVIRMTLRDGKTVELGVLQREPELVLWRRDVDLQYRFPAIAGGILLKNPAITAATTAENNKNINKIN